MTWHSELWFLTLPPTTCCFSFLWGFNSAHIHQSPPQLCGWVIAAGLWQRGKKKQKTPHAPGILHRPEAIFHDSLLHNLGNNTMHSPAISKTVSTGSPRCDLPSSQPLGRNHRVLSLWQDLAPSAWDLLYNVFFLLKKPAEVGYNFVPFLVSLFWSIWSPGVLPKCLVHNLSVSGWEYVEFFIPWCFSALTRHLFEKFTFA